MYFEGEKFVLKPRTTDEDPKYTLRLNSITLQEPIQDIITYDDEANHYNAISINYGDGSVFRDSDKESIKKYKKTNEYNMAVGLDKSNLVWIKHIATTFLKRFSTLRRIVVCQLVLSDHLQLGDKVELDVPERVYLSGNYQIIQITDYVDEDRSEVRFVSL